MFILYEYDIFWAFLRISSILPILAFLFAGILGRVAKGHARVAKARGSYRCYNKASFVRKYLGKLIKIGFSLNRRIDVLLSITRFGLGRVFINSVNYDQGLLYKYKSLFT